MRQVLLCLGGLFSCFEVERERMQAVSSASVQMSTLWGVMEINKEIRQLNKNFLLLAKMATQQEGRDFLIGLDKEEIEIIKSLSISDIEEIAEISPTSMLKPRIRLSQLMEAQRNNLGRDFSIACAASEI